MKMKIIIDAKIDALFWISCKRVTCKVFLRAENLKLT